MVGRMFREAVENLIDDVKESIEEQGRSSGQSRQIQPRPPVPQLELPPNLGIRTGRSEPPAPSAGAPAAAAPVPAAPGPAAPAPVAPAPAAPAPAPTASAASAPTSRAPQAAPTPIERAGTSEPDDTTGGDGTHDEVDDADLPLDAVTFDGPLTAERATPPAASERAASAVARLEADCEAARELYRESRAELREARRLARLAARDERRERRHQRRYRPEVAEAP